MDTRLLVIITGLGLLGFLFYPRPEPAAPVGQADWVPTIRRVEGEPLRFPRTQRTNPIYETYDLGFIYLIDRIEILFDKPDERGPKQFDVLANLRRGGDYRRVFSYMSPSRSYPWRVRKFQETYEARWVQVVVNDWFSDRPKITSVQVGPMYRRDWNPIRSVQVSHNQATANRLIDGLTSEQSKWSGASVHEKTVEKKKGKTETTRTLETPDRPVWILLDIGTAQPVYGVRLWTDGPGNNVRRFRLSVSEDGETYQEVYASEELPDEERAVRVDFPETASARFLRVDIPKGGWYGDYPELREIEVFTDDYRLPPAETEKMEQYNAILVRYDNCGFDNRRSPHLEQGFPFDRGERSGLDPSVRYVWRNNEDIEGEAVEAARSFAYHYDTLRFRYSRLDPSQLYWIQLTYLQNRDGGRRQNLIVDGYLLHGDRLTIPTQGGTPVRFFVPREAVADGTLDVAINRLAGPNAVVSEVSLFAASPAVGESVQPPSPRFAKATRTAVPITIDGDLSEWDRVEPLKAGESEEAPYALLEWDAENLYVGVDVPWRFLRNGITWTDTLDLFIDSRNTRSPALYRRGDLHLSFLRFGSGREVARYVTHFSEDAIARPKEPNIEFQSKHVGNRYVLEARLPKAGLLDEWTPQHGALFGFNYIITTNRGERAYWVAESPLDPPIRWRTVRLFGSIRGDLTIVAEPPPEAETPFTPQPAKTFEANDVLWVLLRDVDRNQDSAAVESVTVTLRDETNGIDRTLDLREIDRSVVFEKGIDAALATDSEDFAARIPTQFAEEGTDAPDVLPVRGKDVVAVLYEDPYATPDGSGASIRAETTARVGTTAVVTFRNASGEPIRAFAAGETLRVHVEDPDLSAEIPLPEAVEGEPAPVRSFPLEVRSLVVDSDATFDTVRVTMHEVADGVFEGDLQTAYGETSVADETLQVVGTQTVEVVYLDRIQTTGRTRVPLRATARVQIGTTARLRIRTPRGEFPLTAAEIVPFIAGTPLIVRIEDADLNTDSTTIDEATITVRGNTTNDTQTVTMPETGPDSGIFQALVHTRYGTTANPDDDAIEVVGEEDVSFTYRDALQGSGATRVTVSVQARAATGDDGTLAIVRSDFLKPLPRFNAGDTLYLRVDEEDEVGDAIDIEVVDASTGDREHVALLRSAITPSEYLGSIGTVFGAKGQPNDGVLVVRGNDVVRVVYRDALRSTGESDVPVEATARVNVGSDGALEVRRRGEKPGVYRTVEERFHAGETLILEVQDPDLNALSEVIEQTTVHVVEDYLNDVVDVTLRETSGNSGVFRGELPTEFASEAKQDNILQVRGQSLITIRYLDAVRADGAVQYTVKRLLYVAVGTRGRVELRTLDGRRLVEGLSGGDTVLVRVIDADLNADPEFEDSAEVTVTGNVLRDELRLPLRETGRNTGVFEARLATEFAKSPEAVNRDDLVLQLTEKEVVTALYTDQLDMTGETNVPIVTRVVVAGSSAGTLLIVDEMNVEIGQFRAGRTLYFWLEDLLLTTRQGVHETTISVRGNRTQDSVIVTLRAIPGEPGRFLGSLPTQFGTTPIENEVLEVQGGEEVRAVYVSVGGTGRSVPVSDTAYVAAGTRGRIEVTRADGTTIREMTPGSSIYLRVEDADANVDPLVPDVVSVRIGTNLEAEAGFVVLEETRNDSGIFRGELPTTVGRRADRPNALSLGGGETIIATYEDPLIDTGETNVEVTAECRARPIGYAPFTEEEVIIDGDPDGWPLTDVMRTVGQEALLWAQWDRDALYLFAQIADDDVAVKDVTRWYDSTDALEIHINTLPEGDPRPEHLSGESEPTNFVFWFCPKGGGLSGMKPYVGRAKPSQIFNFKAIDVASRIGDGVYFLEIRLPFQTAFGGFDPITSVRRDRIGFNFLVYRSDAPKIWWADPVDSDTPPSTSGVLYLRRPETEGK